MLVDMRPVESSENITIMDEIDELLGTRRSYGWNSGSRPSMISAKYRLKEERRKVLKISVNKMKKIDDAESSLCRSVLINNTVKRLQAETRDDRTTGRTSPASPPSPTSVGYGYHGPQQSQPCGGPGGGNPQLVDITNLRESPVGGGGGTVVSVGKTLTNNNSTINNNNNSINNNKPLTDAQQSSSLAADQHHHLHQQQQQQQQQQHHHHHHHHHHHNHNHHHHQLQQQHHHHHQQQQQHNHHHHHQSSSATVSVPGGPVVHYDYDDEEVDDEEEEDDDDTIESLMMQLPSSTDGTGSPPSSCGKRKRSVDEPLDDLLSQFINNNQREDEDVNVVDLDMHEYPAAKRLRTDEAAAAAAAAVAAAAAAAAVVAGTVNGATSSPVVTAADLCSSDCWSLMDTCCDDNLDLYGGQVPAAVEHQDVLLPAAAVHAVASDCCPLPPSSTAHDEQHYGGSPSSAVAAGSTSPTNLSCGQASMFSEMQSAMFRNLIASLES